MNIYSKTNKQQLYFGQLGCLEHGNHAWCQDKSPELNGY